MVLAVFSGPLVSAQTITSVQDGLWDDTATWDCGCVPLIEEAEVLHAVEITGNMIFFNAHVHVAPGGVLFNTTPYGIAITESMTCDGALQFMGEVDIDGTLAINGSAQVIGELHNDRRLLLGDAAAHLHVEGDFANEDTVAGIGTICVTEFTENAGSILGQLDICDATPTSLTPPFLDDNTGFVGPGVTFCMSAACIAGADELRTHPSISLFPVPANDVLNVHGLPQGAVVSVMDRFGRQVKASLLHGTLDVSDFPAGAYVLMVQATGVQQAARFIVVRQEHR